MDDDRLEQLDAYIQVAALGAYADGVLSDEERLIIRECIATHAPDEDAVRLMYSFADRLPTRERPLEKAERQKRVEEVKLVLQTREERERAFVLAVDVANADRGIGLRESTVLLQLMFDLDIDGEFARKIVEQTSRGERGKPPGGRGKTPNEQTLRSPGQTNSGGGVQKLSSTVRSPDDERREDVARAAITLSSDTGMEKEAVTQRKGRAFSPQEDFSETLPEDSKPPVERGENSIQPDSPRA